MVVKDKKDVVVPDLKPEEVEVTENGSKRPVESVRFVGPGEAATGAPSPGNLVSLVFCGMDQNQQKRAKQAVEDLLKPDLGPNTHIGVFRIGLQLWTVQPFTNDLALVRQAVEKAASNLDQALAEPDLAARRLVAETLAQLATGKAGTPPPSLAPRSSARSSATATACCARCSSTRRSTCSWRWRRVRPRRPGARRSSTSRAASTCPARSTASSRRPRARRTAPT